MGTRTKWITVCTYTNSTGTTICVWSHSVFKIEVFNALQTWVGPSKYTSPKTTLQIATPNWKWRRHLEVLNIICPSQEPTGVGHCHYKKVELNDCFLILHIRLETCTIQFMHKFNMNYVFHFYLNSWIDVLDLNQPFNWRSEFWEPFKMKLIWGLQSWTLITLSHCIEDGSYSEDKLLP